MGDWSVLGLAGDPCPGEPPALRRAAVALQHEADAARSLRERLTGVATTSGSMRLSGDYASGYLRAMESLPGELATIERAFEGAGSAVARYGVALEHAQGAAALALRRGVAADEQGRWALGRIRSLLPPGAALDLRVEGLSPGAVEAGTAGLDEATRAQIRAAAAAARQAEADRVAAARLAGQARDQKLTAERAAVHDLDGARATVGRRSWWTAVTDFLTESFTTWDGFVRLCGDVAVVLSVAALFVGGPVTLALLAVSAVLLVDTAMKVARGEEPAWHLALSVALSLAGGRVGAALLKTGAVRRFAGSLTRTPGVGRAAESLRSAFQAARGRDQQVMDRLVPQNWYLTSYAKTPTGPVRSRVKEYTLADLDVGILGATDDRGRIFIQYWLEGDEREFVLRHEWVHQKLTPPPPINKLTVGMYWNSPWWKYLEEAAAEGYSTSSLAEGLAFPLRNGYTTTAKMLGENVQVAAGAAAVHAVLPDKQPATAGGTR